MTIYVYFNDYSLTVIGAKTEKRAQEILQCSDIGYSAGYKLTVTYEEGEEFIETYEE
jgi:hypothetical protein